MQDIYALIFNDLSGLQVFNFPGLVIHCHFSCLFRHDLPALFYGQFQEGLTLDQSDGLLHINGFM
jgi:hypothetical protein